MRKVEERIDILKSTDREFEDTARNYEMAERCLLGLEISLREILKRIKATSENQTTIVKPEYRVWDRVDAILRESTTSRSGV